MTTFIAYPDEGGPFPVVLIYMDALGVRDELRGLGRRLAEAGYFVAIPDPTTALATQSPSMPPSSPALSPRR